jgi:hypothetical protein
VSSQFEKQKKSRIQVYFTTVRWVNVKFDIAKFVHGSEAISSYTKHIQEIIPIQGSTFSK